VRRLGAGPKGAMGRGERRLGTGLRYERLRWRRHRGQLPWSARVRTELETLYLTKEDILVHNGLLGKPAEVAGFGRVRRGYLFLYTCPGEVDIK
jgi:hypothetical protein